MIPAARLEVVHIDTAYMEQPNRTQKLCQTWLDELVLLPWFLAYCSFYHVICCCQTIKAGTFAGRRPPELTPGLTPAGWIHPD